ncbi:MAG TPA: hypothetical protein VMO20_07795 [Candidatus Acidoferrum sp.]|nr:hypothetical protein [Candidatus Acidoferrum sp.]
MKKILPLMVVAAALIAAGCQKNSSESGGNENTMQPEASTNMPAAVNTNTPPMKGTNAP